MSIQYITIKPGSILLCKNYNWLQKSWAYLTKKKLQFNQSTLFAEESKLLRIRHNHSSVILEPKKIYSKKELKNLLTVVQATTGNPSITWLTGNRKENNLFVTINAIRPNTFKEKETDLEAFTNSKYYNIITLAKNDIWNEYIY